MQKICTQCGHAGKPASKVRGALAVELFLWLCFLLPGLIYSVWRGSSRYKACSACGSKDIVPIDSPIGKKIFAEYHSKPTSFTPTTKI